MDSTLTQSIQKLTTDTEFTTSTIKNFELLINNIVDYLDKQKKYIFFYNMQQIILNEKSNNILELVYSIRSEHIEMSDELIKKIIKLLKNNGFENDVNLLQGELESRKSTKTKKYLKLFNMNH
jgi:hypothetical protein